MKSAFGPQQLKTTLIFLLCSALGFSSRPGRARKPRKNRGSRAPLPGPWVNVSTGNKPGRPMPQDCRCWAALIHSFNDVPQNQGVRQGSSRETAPRFILESSYCATSLATPVQKSTSEGGGGIANTSQPRVRPCLFVLCIVNRGVIPPRWKSWILVNKRPASRRTVRERFGLWCVPSCRLGATCIAPCNLRKTVMARLPR